MLHAVSGFFAHPEAMALLEGINANPEDRVCRLVLADWLDELDDPAAAERAVLIRYRSNLPGDAGPYTVPDDLLTMTMRSAGGSGGTPGVRGSLVQTVTYSEGVWATRYGSDSLFGNSKSDTRLGFAQGMSHTRILACRNALAALLVKEPLLDRGPRDRWLTGHPDCTRTATDVRPDPSRIAGVATRRCRWYRGDVFVPIVGHRRGSWSDRVSMNGGLSELPYDLFDAMVGQLDTPPFLRPNTTIHCNSEDTAWEMFNAGMAKLCVQMAKDTVRSQQLQDEAMELLLKGRKARWQTPDLGLAIIPPRRIFLNESPAD